MIVIDASIAIKWLKGEEKDTDLAKKLLNDLTNKKLQITVPQLFFAEVANAIVTKSSSTSPIIKKGLTLLYAIGLKVHIESKRDVLQASLLAKRYHTSVYDMLYAVIAKRLRAKLITADTKFVRTTKFSHVKLLSEYISKP